MVSYGYDRDNAEKMLEIMKYQQGHAIFCKSPPATIDRICKSTTLSFNLTIG